MLKRLWMTTMKNNIILIGFMGIGKGTTARAYSEKYGIYILDTDDLIESKENRKVKKIFSKDGEEYFREQEQSTANWIKSSVKGTMISCGGGFYKVNNINSLGTVVLLDASFEWIYKRLISSDNFVSKIAKRPLFYKEDDAKKLFMEREPEYKNIADIVINVEDKELDDIISEIKRELDLI